MEAPSRNLLSEFPHHHLRPRPPRFCSTHIFSPPHLQRRATIIRRTMHHLLRERVCHFTRESPSPPQQHRAASVFSAPSSLATTNLSRIQQTPVSPPSAGAASTTVPHRTHRKTAAAAVSRATKEKSVRVKP